MCHRTTLVSPLDILSPSLSFSLQFSLARRPSHMERKRREFRCSRFVLSAKPSMPANGRPMRDTPLGRGGPEGRRRQGLNGDQGSELGASGVLSPSPRSPFPVSSAKTQGSRAKPRPRLRLQLSLRGRWDNVANNTFWDLFAFLPASFRCSLIFYFPLSSASSVSNAPLPRLPPAIPRLDRGIAQKCKT